MNEPDAGTNRQTPDDVRRVAPIPVFEVGDTVPNLASWVLVRKLGRGGFGEVWLTRHAFRTEEKPRAVKFCTDPAARHRLVTHEKNVVLRVMKYAGDHPNIVPLLDCNLDGDIPWLMYEFVEGGTLARLIEDWRNLPLGRRLGRAVRALHAIAGALGTFHRFDPPLVHRDMKPQNVLMASAGVNPVPRITDFGIGSVVMQPKAGNTGKLTTYDARLPSALHNVGTRLYAPHEQLLGAPPNPRDDVYALGIIAYQMLIGDLMTGPGADAMFELRDLKIPGELRDLIVRSVAMNADRRPKDATEWETTLAGIIEKAQKISDATDTSGTASKPVLLPSSATLPPVLAELDEPPALPVPLPIPPPLPPPPPAEPLPVAKPVARPVVRRVYPDLVDETTKIPKFVLILIGVGVLVTLVTMFVVFLNSHKTEPTRSVTKPDPKPGETRDIEIAPGVKMTFCWVPKGECQLGSPKAERNAVLLNLTTPKGSKGSKVTEEPDWLKAEAEENRPLYPSKGFWMGKYKVTQGEWEAVMRGTKDATPSDFRVGGGGAGWLGTITDTSRFPVENVSWDMICGKDGTGGFLAKINAHGGIQKAFGKPGAFKLPHEDEWEYACRGGLKDKRPFYFGKGLDGTQANCDGNFPFGIGKQGPPVYLRRTSQVGDYEAKYPHPWGLCDMHGNVWEWCENLYGQTIDRVLRGGSWSDIGRYCRAAFRYGGAPGFLDGISGFASASPGLHNNLCLIVFLFMYLFFLLFRFPAKRGDTEKFDILTVAIECRERPALREPRRQDTMLVRS